MKQSDEKRESELKDKDSVLNLIFWTKRLLDLPYNSCSKGENGIISNVVFSSQVLMKMKNQ